MTILNSHRPSPRKALTLAIAVCIFFSPAFLQGCDSLLSDGSQEPSTAEFTDLGADTETTSKLRFAHLLEEVSTGAGKIDGSTVHLVVGFKEYEADGVTRRLINKYSVTKRLLTRYGNCIRPKVQTDEALSVITVEVNSDSLESFLDYVDADPDLAWAEPDIVLEGPAVASRDAISNTQYISWGVMRSGAREASTHAGNERVHVYLFDSGISNEDVRVVESVDFTKLYRDNIDANGQTVFDQFWQEYSEYWSEYWNAEWSSWSSGATASNTVEAGDQSGHGTHVAGIMGAIDDRDGVAGIAPGVSIHNMKVLSADGRTDISTVLAAIEHVTKAKLGSPGTPIVVNMSLGSDIGTEAYNALDQAIARSVEVGVVYVVAAGNHGRDASTYSPAHVREAITVGSYNESGVFSPFSNFGPAVDLLAPGEYIVSLSNVRNRFLAIQAGTSQAAPHVAGAAALYLGRHPAATPDQVREVLLAESRSDIQAVPALTTNRSVYVGGILETASAFAGSPTAEDTSGDATDTTETPAKSTGKEQAKSQRG
jgi:subtilisin family serine protease